MGYEMMTELSDRHFQGSYWPKDMTDVERLSSTDEFRRGIFTAWKKVQETPHPNDTTKGGDVLVECEVLHAQDLAVRRTGLQPRRTASMGITANEMRRKAAVAEKFNRWQKD